MKSKPSPTMAPPEGTPAHVRLLLAIRLQHEWTQRQLAQELSVSLATIQNWESGRTEPHPMWVRVLRSLLA